MRLARLAFASALVLSASGRAWPQSTLSDNALQAAYCVGVLDESNKNFSAPADMCSKWADLKRFHSENHCNSELGQITEDTRRSQQEKQRRYAQYLAFQVLNAATDIGVTLLVISEKGRRDFQQLRDPA